MNPLAFFCGLLLGLSHYEVYRLVDSAADEREARLNERILQSIAASELAVDRSSALVVEMCRQSGALQCYLEWTE